MKNSTILAILTLSCTLGAGPATAATISLVTNTTDWLLSTVVDRSNSDVVPWPGASTFLPNVSTYTEIPVEGASHIFPVTGAAILFAGSGVSFYRATFSLAAFSAVTLDLSASFDNDLDIFINGHELALEGDFAAANFNGPNHRLFVASDGTVTNGYLGGLPFTVSAAASFPSSFFNVGNNEIVLAVRNLSSGDSGGVTVSADLVTTEAPEPSPCASLAVGALSLFGFRRRRS